MANYNAVSTIEKQVDAPITANLIDKLDQNVHAMFEGAQGAPRLQNDAINNHSITQNKISKARYNFTPTISNGTVTQSKSYYFYNGPVIGVRIAFRFNVNTIYEPVQISLPFTYVVENMDPIYNATVGGSPHIATFNYVSLAVFGVGLRSNTSTMHTMDNGNIALFADHDLPWAAHNGLREGIVVVCPLLLLCRD